ncbi:MAG: siphovirus ReqiPepy6 Gp37-like family protein [Pseudomonadota bacterium]|nr:siphovirus ReqiPepy6 Gp37-like family protein [Pseudomonadota bacterium]
MIELEVEDIVERLADLHAYSPGLAARRPDELHLPEDPAPWLSIRLQYAFDQVASAEPDEREDAFSELERWLVKSYRYYMCRLAEADNPWQFRFPKRPQCTHPTVFTQQ